jgi:hypothetical protein
MIAFEKDYAAARSRSEASGKPLFLDFFSPY